MAHNAYHRRSEGENGEHCVPTQAAIPDGLTAVEYKAVAAERPE